MAPGGDRTIAPGKALKDVRSDGRWALRRVAPGVRCGADARTDRAAAGRVPPLASVTLCWPRARRHAVEIFGFMELLDILSGLRERRQK
ncbi:hypothetical protein AJ88_31885 [Mesorhizobium amorphae CCBAU 01583]|nr:hypothetical protein AJ88_31885 [Mesorhizobium amorphae CCBAU 01583]